MAVMREIDEPEPPDAVLVNRRWVPAHTVDWAETADEIMLEHGAVSGTERYKQRYQARWRAQRLISLMVELAMHERWELREHTDIAQGGWKWTVEYLGGRNATSP